jgi:periplasmic protein TonB
MAPSSDICPLEDLPPHRAAVPVPPAVLAEEPDQRRGWRMLNIAVALGLHCAFVAGALLWGQGSELPPADHPIAVELVTWPTPAPAAADTPLAAPATAELAEARTAEMPQVEMVAWPTPAPAAADTPLAAPAAAELAGAPPAEMPQTAQEPLTGAEDRADGHAPHTPPAALPRERIVGALARLRRMLAASSAAPAPTEPYIAPPLPSAAPRARASLIVTATNESAPVAAIGSWPAVPPRGRGVSSRSTAPRSASVSRRRSARWLALAVYKRRVRNHIQETLQISSPGPAWLAVGLRLSRTGRLRSAFVLRSSGIAAIDREAVRCVRAAAPYPAPPVAIAKGRLAFSIAFRFE